MGFGLHEFLSGAAGGARGAVGAREESERALQEPGERGCEPCPFWHLAEVLDLETGGPLRQGGPSGELPSWPRNWEPVQPWPFR